MKRKSKNTNANTILKIVNTLLKTNANIEQNIKTKSMHNVNNQFPVNIANYSSNDLHTQNIFQENTKTTLLTPQVIQKPLILLNQLMLQNDNVTRTEASHYPQEINFQSKE